MPERGENLREQIRNFTEPLINLVYPRRCPICDEPVRVEFVRVKSADMKSAGGKPVRMHMLPRLSAPLICPECATQVVRVHEPTCLKCGKPLRDAGQACCSDCSRGEHVYEAGCAAFEYRSVSGALYRLKYKGRAEYAEYFGREMAIAIMRRFQRTYRDLSDRRPEPQQPGAAFPQSYFAPQPDSTPSQPCTASQKPGAAPLLPFDALIPVPVSEERLAQRGYNQAGLLARSVSRYLHIPVEEHILKRCRNTNAMKHMSAAARRSNLKKAFLVSAHDVKLSRVMLIDDIYTTGATIDACAALLLQAGAGSVCFATAAIGEDSGRGTTWDL